MNWLNLPVSMARHPAFIGCEPVARATWLSVLLYCVEQENGGVLKGARAWKDRQWQQACGVTLAEAENAAPLLEWKGENLVVALYPKEKEREVKICRQAGKEGGMRSGKARRLKSYAGSPPSTPSGTLPSALLGSLPSTEGEREREEKEKEKGKEEEREPIPAPLPC